MSAGGEVPGAAPRGRAWIAGALVVALLALQAASFDLASLPIVSDVRFYLYFAWRVASGAVPHLDFFDHKTQLATFLGASLHALGRGLGADPLLAIRCGYVVLAALGGWLAFLVQRRLAGGDGVAGALGALAYCSFGLLFLLPATGCVPKLVVALCASGAALLTARRRWLAAGFVGALAALDWQIGALAWLAVFVTACIEERPRRRALARVAAGGALAVMPYFLYFAGKGALGEALEQTIAGSLARSAGTQSRDTLAARVGRIQQLVASDCPGQAWLVYLSLAGVLVGVVWLIRRRETRALLLPLCVFHGGIALFSLFDFQWHADLFLLLHGVVFAQALLWSAAWQGLARRATAPGARRVALGGAALVALAATRPGPLRPELALETPQISPRATLADQRAVAAEVEQRFAGKTIAFLESSELLLLMERVNPLATVFWNDASWAHFRAGEETKDQTLARLLHEARVDAYVTAKPFELDGRPATIERIASPSGQYYVILQVR